MTQVSKVENLAYSFLYIFQNSKPITNLGANPNCWFDHYENNESSNL